MKTGKIVIKDKVYFEYCQLYKPDKKDLKYYHNSILINNQLKIEYLKDMKAYEASKQLIEVSNICWRLDGIWTLSTNDEKFTVKNGTPCKAEVNGTAKIIELIK